jgi:hypothetical protein
MADPPEEPLAPPRRPLRVALPALLAALVVFAGVVLLLAGQGPAGLAGAGVLVAAGVAAIWWWSARA